MNFQLYSFPSVVYSFPFLFLSFPSVVYPLFSFFSLPANLLHFPPSSDTCLTAAREKRTTCSGELYSGGVFCVRRGLWSIWYGVVWYGVCVTVFPRKTRYIFIFYVRNNRGVEADRDMTLIQSRTAMFNNKYNHTIISSRFSLQSIC